MQREDWNEQIPDVERMLQRTASLAKWTVAFISAGMLELIMLVLLGALEEGIWAILFFESAFLILVLAPILALVALNLASKATKVASKFPDLIAPIPELNSGIFWLCLAGIMFAIEGIVVTLFVQNSVVSFFRFESVVKVWMGILIAVGLFLVLASLALARKFTAPLKLPRRLLVLMAFLSVLWAFQSTIQYAGKKVRYAATTKTFDGQSSSLEGTVIVPTLDTPVGSGKNVIWCSSFQLAWNEMRGFLGGGPLQIPGAEALAARLNSAPQSSDDLDKKSYFITAGPVRSGIVERINSELQSRFSTSPPAEFELDRLDPSDFLAYAYLTANVRFEVPFRENREEFIFEDSRGEKTGVKSFGVWKAYTPQERQSGRQIRILYTRNSDPNNPFKGFSEFALDLSKDTEPYQIVLAIVELGPTLADTLDALNRKIAEYANRSSGSEFAHRFMGDRLVVPEMFWRIAHRFRELEDKHFVSKKLIGPVQLAAQIIEFKLDRSGALLESHAALAGTRSVSNFYFNKPFLIYIKKRGREHPFFVMWVDNAELLSRFESQSD